MSLCLCYKCFHLHKKEDRVRCNDCKACEGSSHPRKVCLRFKCPNCNAGTYWRVEDEQA